jgi:hypothetical protein
MGCTDCQLPFQQVDIDMWRLLEVKCEPVIKGYDILNKPGNEELLKGKTSGREAYRRIDCRCYATSDTEIRRLQQRIVNLAVPKKEAYVAQYVEDGGSYLRAFTKLSPEIRKLSQKWLLPGLRHMNMGKLRCEMDQLQSTWRRESRANADIC